MMNTAVFGEGRLPDAPRPRYWAARELVAIGIFAAAAKLTSLLIALAGGGMNPATLLLKNLVFTTLVVVMLYKVRKQWTLLLFTTVNMLISLILLGGSVTLIPTAFAAALLGEGRKAGSVCSRGLGSRISRRKSCRSGSHSSSPAKRRPLSGWSCRLWRSATSVHLPGSSPEPGWLRNCVMQGSFSLSAGERTWLTSLDARSKMAVTAAAAAATIAFSGFWAEFALFAASAVYLASARRWKVSAAAYILMALMMAMSVGCAMVLAHFFPAMARGLDMKSLSIPFLRGLTMMNVILPLAFSTRIQSVLGALQSMRLPFCIYLPAAVMLRFIPTFANDIRQVWESVRIRGWKLGPVACVIHPFFAMRLLLSPILFRTLKTSDELGIAAEMKGLGLRARMTPYRESVWSRADTWLMVTTILVIAAAIALEIAFPGAVRGPHR